MAKNPLNLKKLIFSKKMKDDSLDQDADKVCQASKTINKNSALSVRNENKSDISVTSRINDKLKINSVLKNKDAHDYSINKNANQDIKAAENKDSNILTQETRKAAEAKPGSGDKIEQDSQLEYDSMVLLSRIEQLGMRINDINEGKGKSEVVNILLQITNHIVEFAEERRKDGQAILLIETIISQSQKNYKKINANNIENNRLFVHIDQNTILDEKEFFVFCSDLLKLINVYLNVCIKSFNSERISEQWKTLYGGFFVNLSKSIDDKLTEK